jgi:hypothetical protein
VTSYPKSAACGLWRSCHGASDADEQGNATSATGAAAGGSPAPNPRALQFLTTAACLVLTIPGQTKGVLNRESVFAPFCNRGVGSAALLPAGAGRRAWAGGEWLARALLIFVPAMFSRSLMGSGIEPTEAVAAVRNTSVEVLLPKGGRRL